jgi:hypothetical protein
MTIQPAGSRSAATATISRSTVEAEGLTKTYPGGIQALKRARQHRRPRRRARASAHAPRDRPRGAEVGGRPCEPSTGRCVHGKLTQGWSDVELKGGKLT